MGTFPEFDPEEDVIRLNGGREIMLMLLWKSKFGERFDPETLLHPRLSALMRDLQPEVLSQAGAISPFTREDLHRIGTEIYYASHRNGWWGMSPDSRTKLVQDAVAPAVLSDRDVEAVIDTVDTLRFRNGQIINAASSAKEN